MAHAAQLSPVHPTRQKPPNPPETNQRTRIGRSVGVVGLQRWGGKRECCPCNAAWLKNRLALFTHHHPRVPLPLISHTGSPPPPPAPAISKIVPFLKENEKTNNRSVKHGGRAAGDVGGMGGPTIESCGVLLLLLGCRRRLGNHLGAAAPQRPARGRGPSFAKTCGGGGGRWKNGGAPRRGKCIKVGSAVCRHVPAV